MTFGRTRFACAVLLLMAGVCGCGTPGGPGDDTLFTRLPADRTGIHFTNALRPTEALNTYVFRNFYNGGGVAIGDIDNDGLPDVFLTGNQVSNKLYLNTGGFTFRDITEEAGVASEGVWSTGVSMVDVNGDGWLDIYVCKSGPPGGAARHNELFINNGDRTFSERSAAYGLDVTGLSIHAAFFDYDGDGDLDVYLLSNPVRSLDELQRQPGLRSIRDPDGGNRLFRNEWKQVSPGDSAASRAAARFTDVTADAGLYGSRIGFGLGVSVSDIDRDGAPDIYISNDFFERDYLYVNRGDGTFDEHLPRLIESGSLSSMGGDIADINNDGYPEIFVSDMLPYHSERIQSKISFTSWDDYAAVVEDGYHHQFTRNTLQLNRGIPDGRIGAGVRFSEIGRLAGLEATDWSWGGLFADFNMDGRQDLFVPNGIYKDLLDQDFLFQVADGTLLRDLMERENEPIMRLLERLPSNPVANHMYGGDSDLRFADRSDEWGFSEPSFSNGAAYGDLDNDGDLDLIINNVNMEAFVYQNRAVERHPDRAWLVVDLQGRPPNPFAVGAQVTAWFENRLWYVENQPIRGFQSTVDHRMHLAIGAPIPSGAIDSLVIRWPDGTSQRLEDVDVRRMHSIQHPAIRGEVRDE